MTDRYCIHGARDTDPCEECGLGFVTEPTMTKRTTLPDDDTYQQVDKSVDKFEVRK